VRMCADVYGTCLAGSTTAEQCLVLLGVCVSGCLSYTCEDAVAQLTTIPCTTEMEGPLATYVECLQGCTNDECRRACGAVYVEAIPPECGFAGSLLFGEGQGCGAACGQCGIDMGTCLQSNPVGDWLAAMYDCVSECL